VAVSGPLKRCPMTVAPFRETRARGFMMDFGLVGRVRGIHEGGPKGKDAKRRTLQVAKPTMGSRSA